MQVFDLDGVVTRSFPARAEGAPAVLCRPHGLARGPNGLATILTLTLTPIPTLTPPLTLTLTLTPALALTMTTSTALVTQRI